MHQVHSLEVIDHKSSKGPGSWDGHKKQGPASVDKRYSTYKQLQKEDVKEGKKADQKPWKLAFTYLDMLTYVCAVKVTLG